MNDGVKLAEAKSTKKELLVKLVLAGAAALFLGACVSVYFFAVKTKTAEGEKTARLVIEYKETSFDYEGLTTRKDTFGDLLDEYNAELGLRLDVSGEKNSLFGRFINGLKGRAASWDDANEYYAVYLKPSAAGAYTPGEDLAAYYGDGIDADAVTDGATYIIRLVKSDAGELAEYGNGKGGARNPSKEKLSARTAVFFVTAGALAGAACAGAVIYFKRARRGA